MLRFGLSTQSVNCFKFISVPDASDPWSRNLRHFVKYAARNWLGLIPKGNSERREKKAARGPPALPGRVRRQPGSGEITRCMQPKSGFPSNFSILYHTILIMPIPWFHTVSRLAAPNPRAARNASPMKRGGGAAQPRRRGSLLNQARDVRSPQSRFASQLPLGKGSLFCRCAAKKGGHTGRRYAPAAMSAGEAGSVKAKNSHLFPCLPKITSP